MTMISLRYKRGQGTVNFINILETSRLKQGTHTALNFSLFSHTKSAVLYLAVISTIMQGIFPRYFYKIKQLYFTLYHRVYQWLRFNNFVFTRSTCLKLYFLLWCHGFYCDNYSAVSSQYLSEYWNRNNIIFVWPTMAQHNIFTEDLKKMAFYLC